MSTLLKKKKKMKEHKKVKKMVNKRKDEYKKIWVKYYFGP